MDSLRRSHLQWIRTEPIGNDRLPETHADHQWATAYSQPYIVPPLEIGGTFTPCNGSALYGQDRGRSPSAARSAASTP